MSSTLSHPDALLRVTEQAEEILALKATVKELRTAGGSKDELIALFYSRIAVFEGSDTDAFV